MSVSSLVQESLLAVMLYDKDNGKRVGTLVPPDVWDKLYRGVASRAVEYWAKYDEPPCDHALDIFEDLSRSEKRDAKLLQRLYDSIQDTKEGVNPDYVIGQVSSFLREQHFREGILEAAELLEQGKLDDAEIAARKGLTGSLDVFEPGIVFRRLNVREILAKEVPAYPTGIPELDVGNLGPTPGEFHLLTAPYGRGKCIFGDSLITLADGRQVSIRDLVRAKKPVSVLALDENTQSLVSASVSDFWDNGVKNCYTIFTTIGRRVTTTANHKFYTPEGWKWLSDLNTGSCIAVPNYSTRGITWAPVKCVKYSGLRDTYDLTVPKYHNFVADDCIVHNSWWLIYLSKICMVHRIPVLYVTLELSENKVARRMLQTICGITSRKQEVAFKRLVADEFGNFSGIETKVKRNVPSFRDDGIEKLLEKRLGKIGGRLPLVIRQFPSGQLTVKQLEAYLDSLAASTNFVPKLLVIDYIKEMRLRADNYRIDLGQTAVALRGLAVERGMALATVMQINRAFSNKTVITGQGVGEDYSLNHVADVHLTYNQTPAEYKLDLARIFVDKGRNERDKFEILLAQQYRTGQFCLSSARMSPRYWKTVQKAAGEMDTEDEIEVNLEEDSPRRERLK